MSRTIGKIFEIYVENGVTKAKIVSGGVHSSVPLTLMINARVGDEVQIGAGIALASISPNEKETSNHVLGNPG